MTADKKMQPGFAWPGGARMAVVMTCLMENWSGDKGPPFSVQTTSLRPGTHEGFSEVQANYSREDLAALRAIATPEVVSYFAEDLAANVSKGVVNRVSDVKLLQGDLAESWREGETEYATVAMRYSLLDEMLDRASGRVVSGGPDEATEIWTFMRQRGGRWLLSAIQQK